MTLETPITRAPSAIDEACEKFFAEYLKLSPEFGASLGLPGFEEAYEDRSPEGQRQVRDLMQRALDEIMGATPVDSIDQVTQHAVHERLSLWIENIDSGWTPLNNIASAPQNIRAVLDLMPTATAEDWDHIAGRLENIPEALSQAAASYKKSASDGKIAARRQVDIVLGQIADYTKAGGFFDDLVASAPQIFRTDGLQASAEAAKSGYEQFAGFLRTELLPLAPEKDAFGRERYLLASREFLGTSIDIDETYAWGVAELDRIIAEQERVANAIKPGATIEEAKALLNADSSRVLHGTDALKAWMQEKSDAAVAALGEQHFDIPEPVRKLECMIAPTQEGGIYYTGPSDDFSRPGQMWWSVPAGEDTFLTWSETSTVYHEGVPGHHLQIGTAVYLKETLNSVRRNFIWVSGHGEGWALYAERLMQELGYLDDLGDYLGMLDAQRMRAARVVFDLGVHCELEIPERWGSGVWTPEAGYEFLKKNLDTSPGQLDFEFNRYLGWAGQAPAYKIGERLWNDLRDEVKLSEGAAFDLKKFHREALALGSVGLDTLKFALTEVTVA
ncbi:uncharacterized protein (DUF885 family) [Neomicrococcus aestuarii]|uniref:Uncharacterized protein (DUF885 family) n=1 Tax=Neomicrococcus aestuarii TaxID=556325 RepID=A0A7W8TRA7_9MICC|nr:DUF885 domain-containing protein [Neomicrococcus aestuarii]MBB5511472.1 uncharacterized protein (DUF885 family) [Neomicrococcus aestuarii]